MCQVNPKLSFAINNQTLKILERTAMGGFTAYYINKRIAPVLNGSAEENK
jgi:hypothetical protein